MANIQCKMCGGVNEIQDGVTSGVCQYCGSLTTFPKFSDEQTEHLYSRAEHFRQKNDFDKAVSTYESILNRNSEDPEAYWGLVISRYGIEYVEDPATHERIPTCHRVQYESILADSDYQNALKYASGSDRDIYEIEANRIAEIQKGILRISAQEKPYDVFICYKETTEGGTRTKDSTLAQDIYYQLTNQGLKVFFSRITLEDKLGQQYEPYIFAALNSAKVMLVIGSKKEYFEAVWVKNEWSRFLALMKKDRSKLLIPCYRDMDAYDIPEELSMFQSQDMSKIGFIQDILRGIMKVVNAGKEPVASSSSTSNRGESEVVKMMKRISVLMRQKEWDEAQKYCKKALDIDPENAELYLLMSMIGNKIADENELRKSCCLLSDDKNFQVAVQFASPERKKQLEDIRTQTLVNYYLHECLKANGLSSEKDFVQMQKPLSDDEFYQKALNVALPEQKKELQKIQEEQVEYFLQQCITANQISCEADLSHAENPLVEDEFFQRALKCATTKRQEELQKIQEEQAEYFLQKCMTNNQIFSETDLSHAENPLVEDEFFQRALKCATPKRQEELQKIQEEQVEYFLQRCMTNNQISCKEELSLISNPLSEDKDFQLALSCSSGTALNAQLKEIQRNQEEKRIQKKRKKRRKIAIVAVGITGLLIVCAIAILISVAAIKEVVRKVEAKRIEKTRKEVATWIAEEFTNQFESNGIIKFPSGVELKMVKVEAGTFTMGAKDGENDPDETPHSVTLKHDFYIGQTEATRAQWLSIMNRNPNGYRGDNQPVTDVSWKEAQEFCNKLNEMYAGKLPTGYKFDLPTEAQWEYAARGGKKSKGFKYSGSDDIDAVAWDRDNSAPEGYCMQHPVGTKQANELGLYDMSGNAMEWCRDWYESGYAADPEFLRGNNGVDRVSRGGKYSGHARDCRVASRLYDSPGDCHFDLGFRLALVPVQEE